MKKNFVFLFVGLFCLLQAFFPASSFAQITISGIVYDSTKLYAVPSVDVFSTSGSSAITDSTGTYHIKVLETDSISFFYKGKYTLKFPVKKIANYTSLRVRVNEKYKLLKGITVFSDTYRQDSIDNRISYSKIFARENPTLRSNYELGGSAGFDLDELIGIFQFKKNKQTQAFQKRLADEEQERYIDYRFSSKTISRITGLAGTQLSKYKVLYRPSYYFVVNSTLTEFYQYILNTSYAFKKQEGKEK